MTERYYIAVDGDDVGRSIERLVLTNDCQGLSAFAAKYRSAVHWLTSVLIDSFQGNALLSDGDSVLIEAHAPAFSAHRLTALSEEFAKLSGHTLSIGIGDTMREAYLALKLAKLSGKNQVRSYTELNE
jgi:hypothetical protein